MIDNKKIIKKFAAKKLYGQGLNASLLPILAAALSAINVHEKLGISYQGFIFDCRGDYVVMSYLEEDLEKIGQIMWGKIKKDPNYLKKFRKIHEREQDTSFKLYKKIDSIDLKKIEREELHKLLLATVKAMQNGVGSGHVIEGVSYVGDKLLKEELDKFLKNNTKSNQAFSLLTTPEEKSFLSKAEDLLQKISKDPKNQKLLDKFKKDFGWIRNSYDYRRPFSDEEIIREASSKKYQKRKSGEEIKEEKRKLIKKLNLPKDLALNLETIAFLGSWQDERKKYILLAGEYIFRVLEEYALRIRVPLKYIRFAMPEELKNVEKIQVKLKARYEKSLYAVTLKKIYLVTGKDYDEIHKSMRKNHETEVMQINGMAASSGKVIGRARICSTFKSLEKFKKGDILVTSMTRPEFIGAMRQASAFVTDEGGITCHAAIIAREMQKPCVIGTRNATKILKDGDLIQVDAVHGVVRILENNKK